MAFTLEIPREEQDSALSFATRMARKVAPLAQLRPVNTTTKPDGTLVSRIDMAVEKRMRELIAAYRPRTDSVLGEEFGERLGADNGAEGAFWVIDPIDGTHLLAEGKPGYVISIAYVVRGTPQVAVVLDPNTGQEWTAALGRGGFLTSRARDEITRLQVGGRSTLDPAEISPATEEHYWEHVVSVVVNGTLKRADCSFTRAAAEVASGVLDGAVFGRSAPWGIAAAALLVVETGGTYTTLERTVRQLDRPTPGAVLGNAAIHGKLMEIVESDR